MQVKTIEKVIISKLDKWLSSISDEKLRVEVRKNALLSGGSIASMFLKEEVNDFDIYLKDEVVLLKLVDYYVATTPEDRIQVLHTSRYYDKSKLEGDSLNSFQIAENTLKQGQVKLFFNLDSDKGGLRANEGKDIEADKYLPLFFSPNAISLSDQIQIVTRFSGTSEEIHKTFDFVHATNYFTFDEGLVVNNEALVSLLTKQLRYQGSLYPLTSIIRFKKFVKRGWSISAGEILKIMFQISEFDLKDPQVLEEQLIGVDVAYFSTLIEILRGVEKEKITSQYLNKVIDKVFNSSKEEV